MLVAALHDSEAVVHHDEDGGFWAEVPALPGCVTQADTMEEQKANLHEVIEMWLEVGKTEETGGEVLELTI